MNKPGNTGRVIGGVAALFTLLAGAVLVYPSWVAGMGLALVVVLSVAFALSRAKLQDERARYIIRQSHHQHHSSDTDRHH